MTEEILEAQLAVWIPTGALSDPGLVPLTTEAGESLVAVEELHARRATAKLLESFDSLDPVILGGAALLTGAKPLACAWSTTLRFVKEWPDEPPQASHDVWIANALRVRLRTVEGRVEFRELWGEGRSGACDAGTYRRAVRRVKSELVGLKQELREHIDKSSWAALDFALPT